MLDHVEYICIFEVMIAMGAVGWIWKDAHRHIDKSMNSVYRGVEIGRIDKPKDCDSDCCNK